MMGKRKFCALMVSLLLIAGLSAPVFAKEKPPSKSKAATSDVKQKVALVNGTTISQADFDREMDRIQGQMAMTGQKPDPAKTSEMKKSVLENLIDRELLYQESQKIGINIPETEVDERVTTLRSRFPNEEEYKNALNKLKLTEADLKREFRRDMSIRELVNRQITSKISISESELKAYYDGHPDQFKMPERVRASHILIKVDPGASEAEKNKAREKITEIQAKIKNGDDFAALAKEFSDCPSRAQGGDLDYFQKGQMVAPFEQAAFSLKIGEVSGIVETQFGYHLIKVTDKKEAETVPFDEIKARLDSYLKQEKTKEQVPMYIAQLKEKAKIEVLMK